MRSKFKWIFTLLVAFTMQFSFAQEKTVTGVVSDNYGTLPGASVVVKGTTRGVTTDFDGNYSIAAKAGDVLEVSFAGKTKQSVTVGAASTYNVVLSEGLVGTEIVVTSFGVKREKRELAYVTEKVGGDALTVVQPTVAASALAGKVAGLQINVQNNGVNPSTKIVLRGYRSITQDNSALIVIDGAIATSGAFDALNPADIEDINVMKGPAAAVLYGSRGGNGVLIVTTKKGQKGDKFTVGLNSVATFETVAYMPDFQTQYGTGWQGVYDGIENTNWGPRFDGSVRQVGPTFADGSFQTLAYSPIANNRRDFYDTGSTLQNTMYLKGATDKSDFYLSVGDQTTNGIVPNDDFKRNTFKLNASQTLGKVKVSFDGNYYRDKTNVVGSTIGGQSRPLYWFILNEAANIPVSSYKDWQNDLYSSPDGFHNGYYQNPYWALDTNRNTDTTERFNVSAATEWDAASWLKFTVRFGVNKNTGLGKEWVAQQVYTDDYTRPDDVASFVTDSHFESLQYNTFLLANTNFKLTEDISLKNLTGTSNFTSRLLSGSTRANNLSIPNFFDISNGTGNLVGSVNQEVKKEYGFFNESTFGYKDYLFLTLTGRYDLTSTLKIEDRAYFYPGLGLSFVATDAFPSLKSDILNFAKLSFSNVTVYNDLAPYQINETFGQSATFPFGGVNGFFQTSQSVDANIKKEKLNTNELGLNLSFLKDRFQFNGSYYNTVTTDLITVTTPGPSIGATSNLTNIGQLTSDGIELTLGGTVLKVKDFSWNMSVNYSKNKTVVDEITEGVTETVVSAFTGGGIYAVVGEVYPQVKATSYERDPNGNIIVDATTGNPVVGTIKNLGRTTPDYVLGMTSSMKYKGFTFAATMDYRTGHVYYSQLADSMEFTGLSLESVSSNRQDFVVPNSVVNTGTAANPVYTPNTNIPVTGGSQSYWTDHYNNIKENYVTDATAVKLRELALNYTLPSKFLKNTPLSKISFGIVGRNVLTWLPKENRFSDPEFNNAGGTGNNGTGVSGYFQSPPTRTFGFNFNVEF